MKKIITIFLMLATSVAIYAQGIPDPSNEAAGALGFIQNVGQVINTDNNQVTDINYHSIHAIPKSYYQNNKINFVYAKFAKDTINHDTLARLDMTWIADGYGNSSTPSVYETTDEKVNYYLAHCNSGCDQLNKYNGLLYENIYDNIDMRMYSNNVGYKIYFVVRPGGNPQHLRMLFDGQTSLDVSLDLLTINIGGNSFSLPGGIAYEYDASGTSVLPWTPQFSLNTNGTVEVTGGAYNTNKTLVYELGGVAKGGLDMKNIDWSVYFGGEGEDEFYDVDVNSIGAPQAAGYTFSAKIPMVTGFFIFQAKLHTAGSSDILVAKFNTNLSLAWSTYYGGTGNDGFKYSSEKYGISLDNNGNAFIAAPTMSTDIIKVNVSGSYQDLVNNGIDNIIARFNQNGQLNWSTYFGGEDNGVFPHFNGDIIVDKTTNQFYITGVDSKILPVNPGTPAYMVLKKLPSDEGAYITKFNSNLQPIWSTYYGKSGEANKISSLELDPSGKLLVTGSAPVTGNIPSKVPTGSYTQNYGGGNTDAFVTRFETNLDINWSTYIGGEDDDKGNTIITAKNDKIVILGTTYVFSGSGTFPIFKTSVTNVFNQNTFGGQTSNTYGDATICTFDANSNKENFTYLGGVAGEDLNYAACANNGSNVFLAGSTHSNNFPIPSISNQATNNFFVGTTQNFSPPNDWRGSDVYIMGLNKDFVPEWTTFYGSNYLDVFWADVSYDKNVFFVGSAGATDFPTTSSGLAFAGSTPVGGGGRDAIISRANLSGSTLNLKEEVKVNNNITFYPNPAQNSVIINSKTAIRSIYIYDLLGKLIKEENIVTNKTNSLEMDINYLKFGIYIVRLEDVFGTANTFKFIKN
jgi:hypothetical protein